jgi:MinD-like ATPase involved in chromosome partitioning or flagellar assembly
MARPKAGMTKIVSTHSYRGGTGKSNVTANLAAQLALRGRRVAIVDTDIQSPGIHVLFRVDPQELKLTLNDYLWGRCRVEETAVDVTAAITDLKGNTVVSPPGGVFLVPASVKAGEIARILKEGYDVNALNDGFQDLTETLALDFLLIDTHPGVNEETLLSIAISDTLILILRPDHQDYQGTAVTLELARRLEVPQLLLLVNKALASFDFRALSDRIAATYRTPVGAILPLSEDIVRLGSGGIFSVLDPASAFADGIRTIADLLEA